MAMDGSDEALLSDLHFLIATDEQVQDDFSYLCDLLDESMSDPFDGGPANVDDTSESGGGCNADLNLQKMMPPLVTDVAEKPASTKRKAGVKDTFPDTGARNRFQYRQRQELKALKMQVEQLQAKLAAETLKSSTRLIRAGDISPWEQAARKELFERNRALAENKQLKEALDEHLTFVDHMQNLFKKKPRLLAKNPSSEEWQAYKLAAQHSLRVAAIHAIADRQFQRMQSAFIQAGLFNTTSDKPVVSGSPRVLPDGQILIELRRQFTLPVPYSVVGTACWNVMKTRMDECGPTETMETIDAHTVYHKSAQCVAGVIVHSNSIRRYYAGTNRDVVVWRTVLEDALVPHMSRGSVNNECGWMEVAPTRDDNPHPCRMTFLIHIAVNSVDHAKVHGDAMDQYNAGIERFGLNAGDFRENYDVPLPNEIMGAHMARGKRFQDALQAGVGAAIAQYYEQLHRESQSH